MIIAEIAEKIGGRLEGDGTAELTGLAGIAQARRGDITFLSGRRYAAGVSETSASAIIVGDEWKGKSPCPVIRVGDPDKAFAETARLLGPKAIEPEPGIHPTALVAEDAVLGSDVSIGPYCVLEPGVKIGNRTIIRAACYIGHGTVIGEDGSFYQHVSVREHTKMGDRVIVHNGAVIGSDGFGYTRTGENWEKIPQIGIVEIGNDVEIGANTTIDRARFGKTIIGNGVKIDNLVQIAHNAKIGDNTAIAAHVGISGSASLGKNVQVGGQAGIAGHLTVGNNTVVAGKAGVTKDVESDMFVSDFPAMPHDKARRIHAHMMRLPELKKKIADMDRRLKQMEDSAGNCNGAEQ
jgi:UDP-3-O-[3-hydroxymyristoyl] glucosamine N-acyltransferase